MNREDISPFTIFLAGPMVTIFIAVGLIWLTNGWIAVIFAVLVSLAVAISVTATIGWIIWNSACWIWRKIWA